MQGILHLGQEAVFITIPFQSVLNTQPLLGHCSGTLGQDWKCEAALPYLPV